MNRISVAIVKYEIDKYKTLSINSLSTFSRRIFFENSYNNSPYKAKELYWIGEICIIVPILNCSIHSSSFYTPNKDLKSLGLARIRTFNYSRRCFSLFSGLFFQK